MNVDEVKKEEDQEQLEITDEKPEVVELEQDEQPQEETEEPDKSQAPEDGVRTGIRESAINSDVVAIEKEKFNKDDGNNEEVHATPSFFVDSDKTHRVELDILSNKETGQVVSVSRVGLGIDFEKEFNYLHRESAWFDFTAPSYTDMSTYRQRSGVYQQAAQSVIIDKLQLRNFLLVWHLKDWSLVGKDGKKIELKHDDDGILSDESIKDVYATHTTTLDVVLTVFEKDVLLV